MRTRLSASPTALVVGGGIFGLTAALELRTRGWEVTLIDAGIIPHPDAASTDISKVVRMDYGADPQYTAMGEASLAGWRAWDEQWGTTLFHEDGFLVLSREVMQPGAFEYESYHYLRQRGHPLRRMNAERLSREHPQWNAELYVDGYLNPAGGWAESGRVVAQLKVQAEAAGVVIHEQAVLGDWEEDGALLRRWGADVVVAALGAWTPEALPWLKPVMWATAQPVFHFQPAHPERFQAPAFPVWAADIGVTGWYGFPANAEGVVKVANHGPGRRVSANAPRIMPDGEEERFRAFLRETFPALAEAPVVAQRICLYGDTFDGDFWIAPDPERPGLVVAAGDSGHAFKFAPVLGGLIADAVEGLPNPWLGRFGWREPTGAPSFLPLWSAGLVMPLFFRASTAAGVLL
ncbi:MAG: FAD-dependent oxidoreductase [Prosthecobacter sp.]|nr:FAD-dependent oxidoreductase [Prosthecobacter sp.]